MFPTISHILAQVDAPAPSEVDTFFRYLKELGGWILFVGTGIAGIWMKVSNKARQRDVGPQPFIVKEEERYVSKETFDEFKKTVFREQQDIRKLIKDEFKELKDERRENIHNLHNHITAVDLAIQERLKEGNQRMSEHGESIAALEERTRHLPTSKPRRAQ